MLLFVNSITQFVMFINGIGVMYNNIINHSQQKDVAIMQNHLYLYPNLAKVRKECMTQSQLAEQLGIAQQDISRYETGEVKAPINYIIDVANICKVSVDYILNRQTDYSALSSAETELLMLYNKLSYENKIKIEERIRTLLDMQK